MQDLLSSSHLSNSLEFRILVLKCCEQFCGRLLYVLIDSIFYLNSVVFDSL